MSCLPGRCRQLEEAILPALSNTALLPPNTESGLARTDTQRNRFTTSLIPSPHSPQPLTVIPSPPNHNICPPRQPRPRPTLSGGDPSTQKLPTSLALLKVVRLLTILAPGKGAMIVTTVALQGEGRHNPGHGKVVTTLALER